MSDLASRSEWPLFLETKVFSQKWKKLGLDDATLYNLQIAITLGPDDHPIVAGTGGVRKVRFSDSRTDRGKSGSYRACYVYFADDGRVYLLTLFGKNEKANLSMADKRALSAIVASIEQELHEG